MLLVSGDLSVCCRKLLCADKRAVSRLARAVLALGGRERITQNLEPEFAAVKEETSEILAWSPTTVYGPPGPSAFMIPNGNLITAGQAM